jgi:hypothetical protein
MPLTLDVLAEQLLSLIEIVSSQEESIRALAECCEDLEDRDQAIMVAFMTFFHVLAARHISSLAETSTILQQAVETMELDRQPTEAVKFLQGLATMLLEHRLKKSDAGLTPGLVDGSVDPLTREGA